MLQCSRLLFVRTNEHDPIQVSSQRHAKQSSAIHIESRTNLAAGLCFALMQVRPLRW